ncbi:Glycoprotein-N-acetylgalactosamine 3-beta-galactosyltransferase 1 [Fasciola hepatica]|uniref:Glycoprotein-N-acetylgalactosamine 3-beta-galactosyltransferase 1 n=1 Tax=Fasciola hepatica TaxID=6192 RepID=A0A4E0QY66_FASHE|nr:Glycoprotein-N-acetylgalactosamine 3-beta-galactosyltransferase 1 [Fasciola hepatica]
MPRSDRQCEPFSLSSHSAFKSVLFACTASNHKAADYRRSSWNSMRITLRAIYEERGSIMYFLKAGQSDYIIMENLRHMLLSEDPEKPFLIGHVKDPHDSLLSVSGSAGYVMSRGALDLIVTLGLDNHPACAATDAEEDAQISLCAQSVGVQVRDSFDFLGKSRFSNVSIFDMLGPFPNNTPRWYPQETDYTLPTFNLSKLPASPLLVSFTGVEGTRMYVLEYLLYHLRAFGIKHRWSRDNCGKSLDRT